MTKEKLKFIRVFVALLASLSAVVSFLFIWRVQPCNGIVATIIILWTLGPPIWFALEHMLASKIDDYSMEDLKIGQELASKFWAAIAASLFAIYQLYNK